MSFRSARIAALSREPRFLLRSVLAILIVGTLTAFVISMVRGPEARPEAAVEDILIRSKPPEINTRADSVKLLEGVRESRQRANAEAEGWQGRLGRVFVELLLDAGNSTRFMRPDERELYGAYRLSMLTPGTVPDARIASFAELGNPPSGIIASMHGDLLRIVGRYDEALAAYERGAADAETGADARRRGLDLCRRHGWDDHIRRLYRVPGWREAVLERGMEADRDTWDIVLAAGDWTGLLTMVWRQVFSRLSSPVWVVMASLCGLLWFLVIHIAAGIPVPRWWRGLVAFGLGLLSIPLTHIFDILQTKWLSSGEGHGGLNDILYCISSIGLREETAKLVCFIPALLLLRRCTAAEALAAAACTGIGFAAFENVGYFQMLGAGASVWGRFITANFIHLSLTGLTGLALWQSVRNSRWLSHLALVFVGAVVFHGVWDYSPNNPLIEGDYRWMTYCGLIGIAYYFFGELTRYAEARPRMPSGTFVFLAGGALLISILMSLLSWHLGFRRAFADSVEPVLQLFFVGLAMFYQLRRGA